MKMNKLLVTLIASAFAATAFAQAPKSEDKGTSKAPTTAEAKKTEKKAAKGDKKAAKAKAKTDEKAATK
jgi:hypothetical protein